MIGVAGDIMVDVFWLDELRATEARSGLLLRAGGSAANTAAWLAHLGLPVTFAGCVGDDSFGHALALTMSRHGPLPHLRVVPQAETGAVAVQVGADGERIMRSARGANADFGPEDVRRLASLRICWLHLTGYSLLESPGLDTLHAAGEVARSSGAVLSFDPSSVSVVQSLDRERLLAALQSANLNLILPNQEEANALAATSHLTAALRTLASMFPRVAVSTGRHGAVWRTGEHTGSESIVPLVPLDTTGAGDAFNAGVISVLSAGGTLPDACARGNALAGQAIRLWGGMPSV